MARTKLSEYSTTNSDNTDIENINIAEGCPPSGINNAIRELMVHLKEFQTGASGDSFTFAGGTVLSGTNTISGAAVISGNINSSGSANTFSGGVVHSGTNTFSSSVIISGNINSSGSNTFSGAQVISGNINSSGTNTFSGTTVMSGANTVALAAGAVGTPSLYANGDTNTGIFFPAADTIAFAEGGAEAMRIDSSGQVGIGITAPNAKLEVQSSGTSTSAGGNISGRFSSNGSGYAASIQFSDSVANSAWISMVGGGLMFGPAGTERMRIDSSGNVGIGTSSPSELLHVNGTARGSRWRAADQDAAGPAFSFQDDTNTGLFRPAADTIGFSTGGSERMRITSGGEVYIAGTTDQGAYNLQCNGTAVWGAGAYVNGSDARIKDDIAPIESGLDVVEKLNPVTYRYKEDWSKDQSTQTGFIAQELLVALEGKNYVDGVVQQGGSEGYYSVAYQNIIPILTKAIQELKAELDATKAEVNQLKGN